MDQHVTIGAAQRPGTKPPCADGYDVQYTDDRVTIAVVDGAGHHPDTVRYVGIAPAVITHVGATLGGLAGLITAGRMAHAYPKPPHVSAIYARVDPGKAVGLHWIGDCRAYGWNGEALTCYNTIQTMGTLLRTHGGVPVEISDRYDEWARLGLAQATETTCREAEIPEEIRLVMLCSDGIPDHVEQSSWRELCAEHADAPQALADALVAAAVENGAGYRDDATVVVLLRRNA
ncbi:SpoIIE family protein phosphatase [Kitasatospora sp. NPDC094028]